MNATETRIATASTSTIPSPSRMGAVRARFAATNAVTPDVTARDTKPGEPKVAFTHGPATVSARMRQPVAASGIVAAISRPAPPRVHRLAIVIAPALLLLLLVPSAARFAATCYAAGRARGIDRPRDRAVLRSP